MSLNVVRSITNDFYNKKFKQYTEKQNETIDEMSKHDVADKEFYITANTVLNLAQKARKIFESSEPQEKHQLLNFLLQNLELKDKNLQYKEKHRLIRCLLILSVLICSEL